MNKDFIPALRYHFLTPIYDFFIKLTMPEKQVKSKLIELAELKQKDKILDFGSGTGTLLMILNKKSPDFELIGLDIDLKMLNVAIKKNRKLSNKINYQLYEGYEIPFKSNSFDVVFSSWVFSHLTDEQKMFSLKEIARVLKPNGKLLIADWGKASNLLMRLLFFILQIVDNFKTTSANVNGLLPNYIEIAGFKNASEIASQSTIFGTLSYYKAIK